MSDLDYAYAVESLYFEGISYREALNIVDLWKTANREEKE